MALSEQAARRFAAAFQLYEGLMTAVSDEATDAMEAVGGGMTAAELLGGKEPSKEEEDQWFVERLK